MDKIENMDKMDKIEKIDTIDKIHIMDNIDKKWTKLIIGQLEQGWTK